MLKTIVDAGVPVLVFLAMVVVGMVEFAVFATAFFLSQAPILLAAVLVFGRMRVGGGNNLTGADDL